MVKQENSRIIPLYTWWYAVMVIDYNSRYLLAFRLNSPGGTTIAQAEGVL